MRENKIQADARDQFKTRDFAARHVAGEIEQIERRAGRGKANERCLDRAGFWIEF